MKVISRKSLGQQKVYDIGLEEEHNLVLSNGAVAHNCFNKSHSVAYSVISYQTAWLRTHYPVEFYTALLNSSFKDQDDLVKYIYACKEEEIPLMPPDVNESEGPFTISHGTIIFGLAGIKGLGPKACEALVEERKANGPFTSVQGIVERKINKGTLKALAACGALEEITELSREQLVENLEPLFKYYDKNANYEKRLRGIAERAQEIIDWEAHPDGPKPRKKPKVNEKHIPVMPDVGEASTLSRNDRLRLERQTLGFYLTGHPMDEYPNLSRVARHTVAELKEGEGITDGEPISIPVVVSTIRKIRTKNGMNMASINIEDKSGRMEATIFPRQWKKLENQLGEDEVNIVKGTVKVTAPESDDSPPLIKVIVNDVDNIIGDSDIGRIDPINMTLDDGTEVEFVPREDTNYSAYQQALAVVTNMKRMK